MELISTLKELHTKLPQYGFTPEQEKDLAEYLAFLREREDLLELAQTYHDDIFENRIYTLAQVEALPDKDGKEEGYLFSAMFLARYERMEEVFAKRGISAEYKDGILKKYKDSLEKTKTQYGSHGLRGMHRYSLVNYLLPLEYRIGRLLFEITKFNSAFEVYRNKETGEKLQVALPGFQYMPTGKRPPSTYTGELFEPYIKQDGDMMECFTFDDDGNFSAKPITLKISDWEKVLGIGDDVLSVHIPADGRMTPELIDEAFALGDKFFADHYADVDFKAFVCSSWLLNTDIKEFLNPESNIIRFQNRFRIVVTTTNGYSLFWHVFGTPTIGPLDELVPKNDFQKKFLDRVKAGQTLYNGYGYILR